MVEDIDENGPEKKFFERLAADRPVLDRIYPWEDAVGRRIPLGWLRALAPFVPAWLVHYLAVALGVGSPRLGVTDMAAHALQLASSNPSVL